MGSHSFCTRSPVCLADTVAERQPSGEPHHENDAPEFVGSLLCGPRRRHLVNNQRVVGRGPDECEEEAHALAMLPMRMGGVGLRSAVRCVPSAFWALWANSIQMIHQLVVRRLSDEGPLNGCLEELREAATELERKGFWWQPSWAELRDGTASKRRS